MLGSLENYIREHRKRGFSHEQIGQFLDRHGWHQTHIQAAMHKIRKEEAQKFVAGAIWYIVIVFIVTVGIIHVGRLTGAATVNEVYCVSDSTGLGRWNLLGSQEICCKHVEQSSCRKLDQPEVLKGASGRAFYKADYTCVSQLGSLLINEAGLARCST